ncbi:recombinase family protein [Bradyrhizobium neotropicale]|uniref:recombinase family protein n=1 Tax=Bradyrhizobium neotropicale TaxID=1497615 RepID=UPI001AD72FB6|nr:recombinase family protein [Bradyrhizobium neotropicale]MBO4227568.1 recombinase family protein [Bradyrhizobium neotropicale]
MTVIGYARVSTTGQTLANQDAALAAAGVAKVYREKISGVKKRPELECALGALKPGDTLLVCKLDRLARSAMDLLNILDRVGKAGATFKSLGEAWADTTTPVGRLITTVLSGVAEFERELINGRTAEGRKRAKAEGIRFGRKPKLTAHQQREALARLEAGEGVMAVARTYNVHHSTISRLAAV